MSIPTRPQEGQNISLPTGGLNISITPSESDEDARHRRRKDLILFVAALVCLAILALMGALAAFASTSEKQQEWGMGVLLLIVGGCIGYLTGKSSG